MGKALDAAILAAHMGTAPRPMSHGECRDGNHRLEDSGKFGCLEDVCRPNPAPGIWIPIGSMEKMVYIPEN